MTRLDEIRERLGKAVSHAFCGKHPEAPNWVDHYWKDAAFLLCEIEKYGKKCESHGLLGRDCYECVP